MSEKSIGVSKYGPLTEMKEYVHTNIDNADTFAGELFTVVHIKSAEPIFNPCIGNCIPAATLKACMGWGRMELQSTSVSSAIPNVSLVMPLSGVGVG